MRAPPLLEGSLVDLHPFDSKYLTQEYIDWFNDPEVTKYNRHGAITYNLELAKEYIVSTQKSSDTVVCAIIVKDTARHVGNIALQKIDVISKNAEYSIIVGNKKYWGKGIAGDASRAILRYAFSTLNLHRVYCGTSAANIPMQKLAIALGFKEEGLRKEAMYKDGVFTDVIEYGLLKSDFVSADRELLTNTNSGRKMRE